VAEPIPPTIEPEGMFDGLRPAAILYGAVVDNLATLAASIGLVMWMGSDQVVSEDGEVSRAALEALSAEPEFLLWSALLGLLCTVLGGFVGASRAGAQHLKHGGWVAVASAALGALFMLAPGSGAGTAPPLWYEALGWGLLIPAGLLGGALAKLRATQR
jgi:hypothetical protein